MIKLINQTFSLPSPHQSRPGSNSLESALRRRRSLREFSPQELTKEEISQLLWAAQGITYQEEGLRTTPSAGATYPLEIYAVNTEGIFHYRPLEHKLLLTSLEDVRQKLRRAALDQVFLEEAPCIFVITAIYERTTLRYGEQGIRYVHLEAGHAAQNLLLQAVTLGLAGVPVGAFFELEVAEILKLREREKPIYLIPVGHPRREMSRK